jgi:hypothetical protein
MGQSLIVGPGDQMVMDNILQRILQSQPPCLNGGSFPEPPEEDECRISTEPDEGEL